MLFLIAARDRVNPFLPITVEHLSYFSQVIEIWILNFPVKNGCAKSDIDHLKGPMRYWSRTMVIDVLFSFYLAAILE
jgi:hypothetical protein